VKDKGVTGVGVTCAAPILGKMNDQSPTGQLHVLHLLGYTTSILPKGVAFSCLAAGEGSHCAIPGCAPPERGRCTCSYSVLCGSSRNRQDQPGQLHLQGPAAPLPACLCRWGPGRSRDQRSQTHLHWSHARQDHPGQTNCCFRLTGCSPCAHLVCEIQCMAAEC